MFDWILGAKIISQLFAAIIIYLTISFFVTFSIGAGEFKWEDDFTEFIMRAIKWNFNFKNLILLVIFLCCFCFAKLPDLMVQANINRIKIHYTNPQSIAKIESEALKVINKLDDIINKEINK